MIRPHRSFTSTVWTTLPSVSRTVSCAGPVDRPSSGTILYSMYGTSFMHKETNSAFNSLVAPVSGGYEFACAAVDPTTSNPAPAMSPAIIARVVRRPVNVLMIENPSSASCVRRSASNNAVSRSEKIHRTRFDFMKNLALAVSRPRTVAVPARNGGLRGSP